MAKSKRTPETRERILALLRGGNFHETAYKAAGISKQTFYDWMKTDPDFSDAVEKAEEEAIAFHVSQVTQASINGVWQASAWFLERKRPDRFGRQDRRPEGAERQEITIRWPDEDKQ